MDAQMQLAEQNDGVSTSSEANYDRSNVETAANSDALTDQAIADSIQTSLQNESLQSEPTRQSSSEQYSASTEQYSANYLAFLNRLTDSWKSFSQSSQPLLVSLAWLLAGLITLRIVAAIVGAVNSIPLLAPLFQLIGAGYTVWFTNRYLLRRSTRQELSQTIKNFTGQAFDRSSDLNADPSTSSLATTDPVMLEE